MMFKLSGMHANTFGLGLERPYDYPARNQRGGSIKGNTGHRIPNSETQRKGQCFRIEQRRLSGGRYE